MAKPNKNKLPIVKTVETAVDEKTFNKVIGAAKAFPHVKVIYVNDEGEYHFHPIPGFNPVDADALRERAVEEFEVTKEPVKTEPPVTEPVVTAPVTTEPVVTEPGAIQGEKPLDEITF